MANPAPHAGPLKTQYLFALPGNLPAPLFDIFSDELQIHWPRPRSVTRTKREHKGKPLGLVCRWWNTQAAVPNRCHADIWLQKN
jgi:hypothetical protein